MKKILRMALPLFTLAALSAHAQVISWGSATDMSNPTSDVLNNGTTVDAADFTGTFTINNVNFNLLSATSGGNYSDGSGITVFAGNGTYGDTNFSSGGTPPDSTNYNSLANQFGFNFFNTGTVTLSGLNTGQTYQVEVWSSYKDAAGETETTLGGPTGSNSVTLLPQDNQFATGTFTASGTSESFTFNYGAGGGGYDLINAVSVRDVSGDSTVPEPSTYALMLAGLGALYMVSRRKRALISDR
jgi:hypothetical protein